ncbi:DUF4167 domain-containing protein [Sphingomonas sp. XMGL2]|uniref:DUF4167 domain-containing protein n=1 Tax=Sphingomonas quercus TaxID=2842451 RepID=A0ABS6BF98_9SPHN|nr:DUF4167 domain-containing protein [Sphingomonas quercus]MBU3076849.1 DUF4167 domain-containing protein [Sphingomonas quercus]
MINNRQNGRRGRGRGNGMRPMNGGGGGGGGGQDRGNRIDNRARGNANQLHEKYKTLARDSQMQGDRVMTEYYLQFADHYFRVLSETRGRFEEQKRQRGDFQDDYDGEEGDGDLNATDAGDRYDDQPQPQQARRNGEANGHVNGERQPRPERRERAQRDDRRDRNAQPEREERQQLSFADDEPAEEAPVVAAAMLEDEAPVARRPRGRPRRERPAETEAASRIDGERPLPAFLAEPAAAEPVAASDVAEKPRRRTTRRRVDSGDTLPVEA